MKVVVLILSVIFIGTATLSGQKQMLSKKDNDPNAKKILDKLKKEYDSYKSMELSFSLEMELPGQPKETQKGLVAQEGNKYLVKLDQQEIYCDGKLLWVYLKKNNEVQINNFNAKDTEGIITPKDMMQLYSKGNFAYAITGEGTENNKAVTFIEFKPLDSDSEYSKFRLAVDTKLNKMVSMKVFSKDGSRYSLTVKNLTPNKKFDNGFFVFNTSKYKGVRVEDLRID